MACLLAAIPVGAGADVLPFAKLTDIQQLLPEEDRVWIEAEEFERALRRIGFVYRAPAVESYLQRLMGELYPELAAAIKVRVGNDPVMNAFALPNGTLFINVGLLARVENEAQLVTVLAHEAAHFTHRHSYRQRSNVKDLTALMSVVGVFGGQYGGLLANLGGAAVIFGHSRDLEREADSVGMERVVALGYDTQQSARVFELLDEEAKILDIKQPYIFATHPRLQERIESVAALRAKLAASGTKTNTAEFDTHMAAVRADWLEMELSRGRYKSLIHILNQPERAKLYPAHAPYYLGEAYRLRNEDGDDKRAEMAYHQALAAAPQFATSHRGLGMLYYKRGDQAQARLHFSRYLELAPGAGDAAFVRDYMQKPPPTAASEAGIAPPNNEPQKTPP